MPGEGRVCNLAEVYDSKEFTGVFKSQIRNNGSRHLQNLTENLESPTFFRSIASKKAMFRVMGRG